MRLVVIHASPPCQHYSPVTTRGGNRDDWPDLIEPVRERLKALGCPYVIENVMSAPLDKKRSITLCADNMGLRTVRHRRFEYSDDLVMTSPPHNKHKAKTATSHRREMWNKGWNISITGDGPGTYVGPDAMGIDWMTGNELCEAIPPAYTEYVGKMILDQIKTDGTKPLLLDLFCGAGGASMGYYRAGFDVIGVDIKPMPRYPFEFVQADAMEFLDWLIAHPTNVFGHVSAIHTSPPCQEYSETRDLKNHKTRPKLIEPLREKLKALGALYIIENVYGAKSSMVDPVTLCGTMFGLKSGEYDLRRHRLFESSFLLSVPGECNHSKQRPTVSVFGGKGKDQRRPAFRLTADGRKYAPFVGTVLDNRIAREAMGIDWMTMQELCESIPPAYTEYVGGHLMQHIGARSNVGLAA